jgi:hypothetical protein
MSELFGLSPNTLSIGSNLLFGWKKVFGMDIEDLEPQSSNYYAWDDSM